MALLSGFGDANTDPGDGKNTSPLGKKTPLTASTAAKSETASRKTASGGNAAGKAGGGGDGGGGDGGGGGGGAPGLKGKSAAEVRKEAQQKIQVRSVKCLSLCRNIFSQTAKR